MSIEEPLPTAETTPAIPPASPTEKPPTAKRVGWEALIVTLLLIVLAIGAYFRFTGLDWDQNFHLHPDERFLTIVASSLDPVSDPLAYLKTSESTLNPYNANQGFYVYGNFPMTVTVYMAEWANAACSYF